MTSRELVKRTLEFDSPNRIPRDLWLLPWATKYYPKEVEKIQKDFPNDIISEPPVRYRNNPKTVGDPYTVGTYVDEWGCIFENIQEGIIGEVKTPLLKKWEDIDIVRPPEELLSVDVDEINSFCKNTDKFVLSPELAKPFERLQFIRKSENLYIDLAEQPKELFVLINKIQEFYIKNFELWANTEVDGLYFCDDWGSQRSLLISPKTWRQIFKPLYKQYIDIAHQHGKYIFMHSDGYIIDIIEDLIELGLDAINSQLFCMDIKELGKRFKGKITFWGEIDRQYILSFGTSDDVINAVKLVKESLYENGGVIAQSEFGPGVKPENLYLVFKTWNELV